MILDNQDRLVLNDQSITSPHNEPHRSPGFVQKQPPEMFCKKRCSKNFRKFHRKTPVLESLFNNVAGVQAWNFIKKILLHWCFPIKFAKRLRTSILQNIWERLLLFVSPQNNITNSGGEFGLDETSAECNVNIQLHLIKELQFLHSIKCSHIIYM